MSASFKLMASYSTSVLVGVVALVLCLFWWIL
jgi:hypothetical protein